MSRALLVVWALLQLGGIAAFGRELERIPYDPEQPCITLPVVLDGREYSFVLDTGATVSVYDDSMRPLLGDPVAQTVAGTINGTIPVELFAAPNASIGELPFKVSGPVACVDVSPEADLGPPADGIIGMDFLREYIVRVDPDATEVRFFAAETELTFERGGVCELRRGQGGIPQVIAWLNNRGPLLFHIDLGGATTAHLSPEYLAEQDSSDWQVLGPRLDHGLGGHSLATCLRADSFVLGHFLHDSLVFTTGNANRLGLYYLTRYKMTFDFPRDRLYLERSARFSDYDGDYRDGIVIARHRKGYAYVAQLQEDSPAFEAGLRTQDRILRIDDYSANDKQLWWFTHYLTQTTKHDLRLLVERGFGQIYLVTLPAARSSGRILSDVEVAALRNRSAATAQ